ncbi:Dyp-type peroxidase [Acidisoma sp.]|uniref:Dyp-type peroxidase n=1 Tax=Acidisoma sp. TaxID=1872115 RepID=UPI003AFFD806
MSCPFSGSRRGMLAAAGGLLAATTMRASAQTPPAIGQSAGSSGSRAVEPFYGPNQAGIATAQQTHCYVMALDLVTARRADVVALLKSWTAAAARMTAGQTAEPLGRDLSVPATDGGSALDLPASRLTLTFGFGPGLFVQNGADRYGLAARRPAALVDMPRFNGDQLDPRRTGGDLVVQACADDPQVAFHAVRELVRLSYGNAQPRWAQSGFLADAPSGETPRNLMGFKDGTQNPGLNGSGTPDMPARFGDVVWAGAEGPDWMRGGSYMVARRIRISLEHWDRTEVDFQEQVIGRHKMSGAPLGKSGEFEPLGLDRVDSDGNPVIPQNAHVRLGAAAANGGAEMLRRAYSYNDGLSFTAERWPPWRQGMMYDAGLMFLAYQSDPRTGFIRVFEPMSKLDALNQFVTHTGSGLFACPPGVLSGQYIGQRLFEA